MGSAASYYGEQDGFDRGYAEGIAAERVRIVAALDCLADQVRGFPRRDAPKFECVRAEPCDECTFESCECETAILCALDKALREIKRGEP